MPVIDFHGTGPVIRMSGMRRAIVVKCLGEFDSREVRTEAVVDAAAERQHRRGVFPGDVEAIGIRVHRGVAVGRSGIGDNECACRDPDAGEFDVFDGDAHRGEDDGGVAHRLLDGLGRELGMLGE